MSAAAEAGADSQVLSRRNEPKIEALSYFILFFLSLQQPKVFRGWRNRTTDWSADFPLRSLSLSLSARLAKTNVSSSSFSLGSLLSALRITFPRSLVCDDDGKGVLIPHRQPVWGLGRPSWPFPNGRDNDILMAVLEKRERKKEKKRNGEKKKSREPIIHHESWHHYLSISCRLFCVFLLLFPLRA